MCEECMNKFAKETIVAAGKLLQSFSSSERIVDNNIDLRISRFIVDKITQTYPNHQFTSEEEPCSTESRNVPTWIIDPIDGSDNFYRGILSYSISMSLVYGEDILLGAVYEPYVDRLYYGAKGLGSTLNGYPLHVSTISNIRSAIIAISRCDSFLKKEESDKKIFQKITENFDVRILASTALDMCHVASGAIEARIMANTHIWDNSAATLLVQEAGGMVTDWNGKQPTRTSKRLVASNGLCHNGILEYLNSRKEIISS